MASAGSRIGTRAALLATLAVLLLYSTHLAFHRIFQVDEAQNVFSARILAEGTGSDYYTNGSLMLAGPLTWVSRHAKSSAEIFTASRLLFAALFWLNLALVPIAMGFRPFRTSYLWALLGTATLAPLWDYGFEIRHDNLALTLLLLLWIAARSEPARGMPSFVVMGALAATLQAVAFKSFLYWVPFGIVALAFTRSPDRFRRVRLAAALLAGFGLASLGLVLVYQATGLWPAYTEGLRLAISVSKDVKRSAPWDTLERLLDQTPHLVVCALAALAVTWADWKRRGTAALAREGPLPDLLVCLVAFGALVANPTPFPYNLVLLVPFMVVPLRRAGMRLLRLEPKLRDLSRLSAALLVVCHATPFIKPVLRHLEWTNERQRDLMALAESLTDPDRDLVFDGIGLVPTRKSVGRYWFLHSLYLPRVRSGSMPSPAAMLAANPASVILRSYRTDWFSPDDLAFVNAHYLGLSDEILVLGGVLPPGGGAWECIHAGTYSLLARGPSPADSALELLLDGKPYSFGARVRIEKGLHRLTSDPRSQILVIWTGPRSSLPALKPGNHRTLFFNWY